METLEILRTIFERSALSKAHEDELIHKRGFTKDVIEKLELKSFSKISTNGIPNQFINELNRFDGKIMIPYFDENRNLIHLRPHKDGFAGLGHHVYVPAFMPQFYTDEIPQLVLAESEFKAIASCIYGVPAIGIPGISSFSKKNLHAFVSALKIIKPKEVIIVFDNEIKDSPLYKNYKPDYTKRFDTIIYAYLMAYQIKRAGYESRIATLNPEWMEDGKADIDGILARGVSEYDYKMCLLQAKSHNEYKSSLQLNPIHKSFIERKIDCFFYNGLLKESYGCYVINDKKDGKDGDDLRKISNFVIEIIYTIFNDDKCERYCKFVSKYGHSKTMIVSPDLMVSKNSFQKVCYELGDFEFFGSDKELAMMWHYAFLHQKGKTVEKVSRYGFDLKSNVWFFENGAYVNNQFYPRDDNDIITIDDRGFLLPKICDDDSNHGIPAPCLEEGDFDLKKIGKKFQGLTNSYYGKVVLAWTIGNFLMPEILDKFKVYPFLFIYGKARSGKSTIASLVAAFFGFNPTGISYGTTTKSGLMRLVSAHNSMIPIWIEEYRASDPKGVQKSAFFREAYDRSITIHGTKTESDIKVYTPRCTFMFSGEELPTDAALFSRCISIPLFRNETKVSDELIWMQKNQQHFSKIGDHILRNKDKYVEKFYKRCDEYLTAFDSDVDSIDNRARMHLSIVGALGDIFLGEDKEWSKFIRNEASALSIKTDSKQALYVFYEDLLNLWNSNKIDFTILKSAEIECGSSAIAFQFNTSYGFWEKNFSNMRSELPASKGALLAHITSEPYYLTTKKIKFFNKYGDALILDGNNPLFPKDLRLILESSILEDYRSNL